MQRKLFKEIQEQFPDLTYYDVDIASTIRYAAAYNVFMMAYCQVTADPDGRITAFRHCSTPADLEPRLPPLRILRLKPDIDPSHAAPRYLVAHFGKSYLRLSLEKSRQLITVLNNHIRRCLDQCDFIVLQDIFPTETEPYADVLMPAASFVEKSGTFTNTERRIQLVRKAIQTDGDAWEDWRIISSLARRLLSEGKRAVEAGSHSAWDYTDPEEIMKEIASLTHSYAGVSHARLERGETFQWPVKDATHPGTPILHVGEFTRGLGKFTPIEHIPPQEMPDAEYPMLLSTGRVLYHWHGGEMTRRSQGLLEIYSKPLIEINEEDALLLKLNGSKRIRVSSRRGSIEADAWVTDRVPPGMVYANFHFPEASANELTIAALDPVSKIPEFKICAVKIEAV